MAGFGFSNSKAVLEQLFLVIVQVRLYKEKGLQQCFVVSVVSCWYVLEHTRALDNEGAA
jgi:hypothetical protein